MWYLRGWLFQRGCGLVCDLREFLSATDSDFSSVAAALWPAALAVTTTTALMLLHRPLSCSLRPLSAPLLCWSAKDVYINQSGYMRQTNTGYLDSLTVLENLVYAAMLRFPAALEAQSKRVKT